MNNFTDGFCGALARRIKAIVPALVFMLGMGAAGQALAFVVTPAVESFDPADGSSNAPVSSFRLTFDQDVVKDTGSILIKKTSDDTTVRTIDVTTGQVAVSSRTVTITPTVPLDFSEGYYIQIPGTAFKNGLDAYYAGIADTTTWNFTTAPAITVIDSDPEDNETDIAVGADLWIRFSEPVTGVAAKNITIKKYSDDSVVETILANSGQVTEYTDGWVSINPANPLLFGTAYYVEIAEGAFVGSVSALGSSDFTGNKDWWNFTTAAGATVIDKEPAPDATGVLVGANLRIRFSEAVTGQTSKDITIYQYSDDAPVNIIAATSVRVTTSPDGWVTIDPSITLDFSTKYYVLISAGAFVGNDSAQASAAISGKDDWSFTTEAEDTVPDDFAFTDQIDVAMLATITSNPITVSGINSPAAISVSGGGSSAYSINGGSFTSVPDTVNNGDMVRVRHTSAGAPLSSTDTTLTIGGKSDIFTSTTVDPDAVPADFSFVDQTNVPLSTLITSAPVHITGNAIAATWFVSGAASSKACVSSGDDCSCDISTFDTSGEVPLDGGSGHYICAQHTSSALNSTATDTVVTVGGKSDTFTSTTIGVDSEPDVFSFLDQTGVPRSTTITSNAITVAGILGPAPISVTGGEYQIGLAGSWTTLAGSVNLGDTVRVRHTSSASFSTAVNTTLTIGGISDIFTSTTAATDPSVALTAAKSGLGKGFLKEGTNKILCGPTCSANVLAGQDVQLLALAQVDSIFTGWSGVECKTGGAAANPCTVNLLSAATATAAFGTTVDPGFGPRVTATINALPAADNMVLSSPLTAQYTLRDCSELFVIVRAPSMGIGWSFVNSGGSVVPITTPNFSSVTPYRSSPANGTSALFSTVLAPPGTYEMFLICDNLANGVLDLSTSTVFTHALGTVN